jgi:hypothetical protein
MLARLEEEGIMAELKSARRRAPQRPALQRLLEHAKTVIVTD